VNESFKKVEDFFAEAAKSANERKPISTGGMK